MNERYYKVLRARSLPLLKKLLSEKQAQGWEAVGNLDLLQGEYAQPIRFTGYEDDVTETITVRDINSDG